MGRNKAVKLQRWNGKSSFILNPCRYIFKKVQLIIVNDNEKARMLAARFCFWAELFLAHLIKKKPTKRKKQKTIKCWFPKFSNSWLYLKKRDSVKKNNFYRLTIY